MPASANTIGGAVTIGASADNSTIKMTFGSYQSSVSAATATWGIAYLTPASDWATSGKINISLQVFNPGATFLNETTDNERIKANEPIGFNLTSTATVVAQKYGSTLGTTYTTSANLTSVTIPGGVGTLTETSGLTATGTGNVEYHAANTTLNGAGGLGTFSYAISPNSDFNAPLHAAGNGEIMTWSVGPTAALAATGVRIYVSDFYKTATTDSGTGAAVYAAFHLIGINGGSAAIGAKAADIVYVTPEPGTWGAILGVAGMVGWQLHSRHRRPASAVAAA